MEALTLYTTPFFEACLAFALALPLVSAILTSSIPKKYAWVAPFLSTILLSISVISAINIFFTVWNHASMVIEWNWFLIGTFSFTIGIYLNNVAVLMLMVVLLISFLVHLYSIGYMADDSGIVRYFAALGFFTFTMLGIIIANNLLMIFIFWELVGFSSYMLIGHWQEKPEAAAAAKKAFIFNRIGDAGFLIGLMLLWTHAQTFDLVELQSIGTISWQTATALCIFCGVMGKSAQFPLFNWLPDAMEGPTPVSALIHAATMVAAGVFLLARIDFLFTPEALNVVLIIGAITALMAALSALVQTDIKKVLAYSTISQLGLMITAIGAGAPSAAMLHLVTHAFFKACLFLSAGAVIHSLHQAQHKSHTHFDVQDIRNLGGLKKRIPFTFIVFIISGSALAGLPFFSGFISKDAILSSLAGSSWRVVILADMFVVSFITVLYTFRLVSKVFLGEERSTRGLPVTEPSLVMRIPLIILAVCSLWFVVSWNPMDFNGWLFKGLHPAKYFHFGFISWIAAAWVLLALGVAYFLFRRSIAFENSFLKNGFALDDVYHVLFSKTTLAMASLSEKMDRKWIDGFIHGIAYVQVTLAHITGWFDRIIIDGSVNGVAGVAKGIGSITRSFQGGKIQLYIVWSVLAIIIFLIWTLF